MRRMLAIFLLTVYVVGTTEAYQLLKVPALVVHFIQHAQEDPELDVVNFLRMHYAEDQRMTLDWQQDMQLPFKTHEDGMSLLPLCYEPMMFQVLVQHPATDKERIQNDYYLNSAPGIYAADIFQPPKV